MKKEETEAFLDSIGKAEMVLVGLGEEFDDTRSFRHTPEYIRGKELLAQSGQGSLIPAWQRLFREEAEKSCTEGLGALAALLEGKNYFVVSVSTNAAISRIPWREGRLVTPCGSDLRLQCGGSCGRKLHVLEQAEREKIQLRLAEWRQTLSAGEDPGSPVCLEKCPVCGRETELNNIYSARYDESGYLQDWERYTKWLQGTLNKRVAVVELGVGMQFPTVIRFPFERVAFFNQKAKFYRINENLYQLTQELAPKGVSFAKNAIDWLGNLC